MLHIIRSIGWQLRSRILGINRCLKRTVYCTGIEYAETMKETGMKKKVDPTVYKCSDYFKFDIYSYYDKELEMKQSRVPQPSNKKPDEERKGKP